MLNKVKGSEDFDSNNFIVFMIQWRKPLLYITLAALIASIVFSSPFFITPKYKSTVIMFPTSSNSISKALLAENTGEKQDILEFGEEEQTEQMLQILSSNLIRERIIAKYNLMEHYEIKPDAKYKYTKLYDSYEENVTFRRTEYMAVKITVLDKDPVLAAKMANDIAELMDSTKNVMQKERALKAFQIVEGEYMKLREEVQVKEDSLTRLRELGVHDYETQAEMINQQLAIELAKGNKQGIKALEEKLAMLAKYGGPYVSLRDALEHDKKQLSEIKTKFDEAKIDATEVLPQKFIVNNAYVAEKKSYPVRWIIVLVSVLSALLLSVIVLAVLDSVSRYNKKKSLR
jgi:uncharacterized protein involved in exopolysaccharide biosynthesis